MALDGAAEHHVGDSTWLLAPVVIGEAVVGVAVRKTPPTETPFIEVFACCEIARKLDLTPGDRVGLRIHAGLVSEQIDCAALAIDPAGTSQLAFIAVDDAALCRDRIDDQTFTIKRHGQRNRLAGRGLPVHEVFTASV